MRDFIPRFLEMAKLGNLLRHKFPFLRGEGFTLLETIVVITITIFLSAMVLTYSHSGENQIVLYRDQATIVGILNQAKSLAIQKFNQPASGHTACAFGVHFQSDGTYLLYQDVVSGISCPRPKNYAYDPGNSLEKIQNFSLDSRLQFNLTSSLDIAFIPPELAVTSTQALPVVIPLQTVRGGASASIQVGLGGQIVTQ